MKNFKNGNTQINISIPSAWKTQLENIARMESVDRGRTITFLDLMREAIQEKFQLEDVLNE
ncbi:hypothetical protein ACTQZS_08275 [Bilifractor sp. LCP19S3_H10]|uniref:hypothetical protein n=1 Tax=Bilifractor sp. LCP19S3_H10 TaxID=3438736 RepID=UPI003F9177DF